MLDISILVVEDESSIREMMVKILSRKFRNIIEGENGLAGYNKYLLHKPDIIVSDIHMPILDGLGMVEKIRSENVSIPILLVSAFNDQDNLMKAINLGIDRFLTKPLNIPLMHRELEKISIAILDRKVKLDYEEKMTLLTQAILNSSNAISIVDQNGNLMFFNNTFGNMVSLEPRKIVNANVKDIFHTNKEIIDLLDKYEGGEEKAVVTITKSEKVNSFFELSMNQAFNTSGERKGILMSFHDITMELESKRNLELEKEKALRHSKIKTEFLSAMSHDIRTPMNLIIGLTDVLTEEITNATQLNTLNLIRESGNNMLHLINDILDVSKIEAGKLELENIDFDLSQTINYLINIFSEPARKKSIDLSIDYGTKIHHLYTGDPYRLQQILINLIGNSLKFTDTGHIKLFVHEKEIFESQVVLEFTVSDSGKGIKPEYLKKIFTEYEQESASITRQYGGTGLGISIAKKLCNLMGGDIQAVSPAVLFCGTSGNPGTEFTFTVLVDVPDKINTLATNGIMITKINDIEAIMNSDLHVLIVEDNTINQMLFKKILDFYHVKADVANNGVEAIDMAQKFSYHGIFMDIEMPELNGQEAAIQLRKKNNHTPIIACTAHNFKEELDEYIQCGMDNFLIKPVNKKNVQNSLEFILSKNKIIAY